jgi:hypothetical protein
MKKFAIAVFSAVAALSLIALMALVVFGVSKLLGH